jgi:N-acetylglucosaminyl-diphospho-decaprenol L-rhamnosyltransferase
VSARPPHDCGVGIVIATCDDGETLLPTLGRLAALPERPPIVVVDTRGRRELSDTIGSAGHGRPLVDVITLYADHGPAARTIGVRRLSTELVAFCDDDSWFAPGALLRAAQRFARDPVLALLQARVLVGPEERLDPTCAALTDAPALLGFLACGVVLRRRALLQVNGFEDHRGFGGEERPVALDLATAGWRLVYDPRVVAHHHPRPSDRRSGRHRQTMRNDLWTAWSRLPLRMATRQTAGALRREPRAAASALIGLPRVLRRRRPIPPAVAAALRAIDHHEREEKLP